VVVIFKFQITQIQSWEMKRRFIGSIGIKEQVV